MQTCCQLPSLDPYHHHHAADGAESPFLEAAAMIMVFEAVPEYSELHISISMTSHKRLKHVPKGDCSTDETIYTLDIGPLLLINQPISLSHIAMVLYAAGPRYTGVFLGAEGDGYLTLRPAYCTFSLMEATESKINRTNSGKSKNSSESIFGAFEDVTSGPLLNPKVAIACRSSQVLLALSNRWCCEDNSNDLFEHGRENDVDSSSLSFFMQHALINGGIRLSPVFRKVRIMEGI